MKANVKESNKICRFNALGQEIVVGDRHITIGQLREMPFEIEVGARSFNPADRMMPKFSGNTMSFDANCLGQNIVQKEIKAAAIIPEKHLDVNHRKGKSGVSVVGVPTLKENRIAPTRIK